ncbi:hypothetical protein [Salinispira pacifica]
MQTPNEFNIRFPEVTRIEQGKEYFLLDRDGVEEKILFHDYGRIYDVPGLYEYLFYEKYECTSPRTVCSLLKEEMARENGAEPIVALDVGAGNGMVGEELASLGAAPIVGIDILPEAATAALRDRPEVYESYHVVDLTDLAPGLQGELHGSGFNCMTVVAALGFDDIPPAAFAGAYNLLDSSAWVAFNIREDFLSATDRSGFAELVETIDREKILDIRQRRSYRHRVCQDGTPLFYQAVVGKKLSDIPMELFS